MQCEAAGAEVALSQRICCTRVEYWFFSGGSATLNCPLLLPGGNCTGHFLRHHLPVQYIPKGCTLCTLRKSSVGGSEFKHIRTIGKLFSKQYPDPNWQSQRTEISKNVGVCRLACIF